MGGNLQFVVLVLEAALIGLCVLGYFADHVSAFGKLDALGTTSRSAAALAACALPLAILAPTLLLLVRDSFRTPVRIPSSEACSAWATSRAGWPVAVPRPGRAVRVCWLRSVPERRLLSAPCCADFTETSVRHLPSRGASWGGARRARLRRGQRDLLRRRQRALVRSARACLRLADGGHARRWLVIRESDLAELNALYRARRQPARNVPVFDAGSSEILLISSEPRALTTTTRSRASCSTWRPCRATR